jgi:hypothetical protein
MCFIPIPAAWWRSRCSSAPRAWPLCSSPAPVLAPPAASLPSQPLPPLLSPRRLPNLRIHNLPTTTTTTITEGAERISKTDGTTTPAGITIPVGTINLDPDPGPDAVLDPVLTLRPLDPVPVPPHPVPVPPHPVPSSASDATESFAKTRTTTAPQAPMGTEPSSSTDALLRRETARFAGRRIRNTVTRNVPMSAFFSSSTLFANL